MPSENHRNEILKASRTREATTVEEAMNEETPEDGHLEESAHTGVEGLQRDVSEVPDREADFDPVAGQAHADKEIEAHERDED